MARDYIVHFVFYSGCTHHICSCIATVCLFSFLFLIEWGVGEGRLIDQLAMALLTNVVYN